MESAAGQGAFWGLHVAWFVASILGAIVLYRRPNPRIALLIVIAMHAIAFVVYYGNLPRPYAIGVSSDRGLDVGMTMAVANGGSPLNHVQIEFASLEPFWLVFVAALSGFSIDRVPFVYDNIAILIMALTGLGFYAAWSKSTPGEDVEIARWRGVLVAASVLGLSSFTLSHIGSFWQGNFVFKPNHALAFGLVGLLSRFSLEKTSWVVIGLIQGLLIWVFIVDWAYVLPGIFFGVWMSKTRTEGLKRALLGTGLGFLLGLPYVLHLMRDYNPFAKGDVPMIWLDHMGDRLADPYLWTLDQGPLLLLSIAGLYLATRVRAEEPIALGVLITGPLVAVSYLVGMRLGFAPEPDEGFHYVRLIAGAGAGYAAWRLATRTEKRRAQRAAVAFGLTMVFSFPAYFNPFLDDPYYIRTSQPLPPSLVATATWIRNNTAPSAIFISSDGITLAALTGRRFLMVRPKQTPDRALREQAERDILTSHDEAVVRAAAKRYNVSYVVLDEGLRRVYGDEVRAMGNRPWFQSLDVNGYARMLRLKLD